MVEVICVPVTPLEQNARIIASPGTGDAAVVDPGGDVERILAQLEQRSLKCRQIWLTHSHFDHCGGVRRLKAATGARLYAHPDESALRSGAVEIAAWFGFPEIGVEYCPEPDEPLHGGETLTVGSDSFQVLAAPGHSPGHLCFYSAAAGLVITGDVLFSGSIGRTDLPGGDHELLLEAIRSKLLVLPDETKVLSGHGPDTTIGRERRANPFLTGV